MKRRILVIGATGLLGAPVAHQLKKSGFDVRLMVRKLEKAAKLKLQRITTISGTKV